MVQVPLSTRRQSGEKGKRGMQIPWGKTNLHQVPPSVKVSPSKFLFEFISTLANYALSGEHGAW